VISQMKILLQNPTIINLLNNTCFDCEPGLFSNKGIIIKTFKEFLDLKKIIQPFCTYMAHIDVWCGVSIWLNEVGAGAGAGSDSRNLCSFITDSQTPIVKGSSLWNICCDKPVYNDVKLGYEEDTEEVKIETFNNLLITGPNGSGKSTYIKSVIECILLGQTIGVVPAKEFSFTPFVNIGTYLNIPDCQGKESLFQAEMNRCYQQIQMLTTAEQKGDFSFNIMDEIFVSTNYQEGMSGAYAIIKKMCNLNKCLNIITTHFDVLAGMDEVKVDKQYFDIEIDENDKIKSDYKIKAGVSKKHLALKLLKQKGFDASIIADAEFLYEKLQGFDTKKKKDEKEVVVVVEDGVIEDIVVIDSVVVEENLVVEEEKSVMVKEDIVEEEIKDVVKKDMFIEELDIDNKNKI
jgi:DNA mismatch repair ATPase MutS